MFGGIDFHFEKKTLILSYAFSPFGRRQFVPAVWIELDEEGSIRTLSRKINARPTREDRATDSPEAKGNPKERESRKDAPRAPSQPLQSKDTLH